MLATDWAAYAEMPADTLKGITGISGLYEREPILLSHVNEHQRPKRAPSGTDPCGNRCPPPAAALLTHGGHESDE